MIDAIDFNACSLAHLLALAYSHLNISHLKKQSLRLNLSTQKTQRVYYNRWNLYFESLLFCCFAVIFVDVCVCVCIFLSFFLLLITLTVVLDYVCDKCSTDSSIIGESISNLLSLKLIVEVAVWNAHEMWCCLSSCSIWCP